VNPNALFDIHVKRIHEYKRQLLNILRVIHHYLELKTRSVTGNFDDVVPRVVIFAGKAAPGYRRAKLIIKLINSVAERVNKDTSIKDMLKVVFLPDYKVSLAEIIIPASDISQHISTAGTEASGTSNMKFVLNGGIILGTLDGANIEIRDNIGHENMFVFGLTADKVEETRRNNHNIHEFVDPRLKEAVNQIRSGMFGDPNLFNEICDNLIASRDYYLIGNDFGSYVEINCEIEAAFKQKDRWAKMSILNAAGVGMFTSDRAIMEYAKNIWDVSPLPPPQIPASK
jgi:starch phosphorylase